MADNYTITDQRQTSRLKPGGGFEEVMEVTFQTVPSGVVATAEVPLSRYSAENVADIVAKRATDIEAVHNL